MTEKFKASFSSGKLLVKSVVSGEVKTIDIKESEIKRTRDYDIASLDVTDERIKPKHKFVNVEVKK